MVTKHDYSGLLLPSDQSNPNCLYDGQCLSDLPYYTFNPVSIDKAKEQLQTCYHMSDSKQWVGVAKMVTEHQSLICACIILCFASPLSCLSILCSSTHFLLLPVFSFILPTSMSLRTVKRRSQRLFSSTNFCLILSNVY